uniref:Uncharacterized protein n=1 Tax=viral metagenome TaxID=1070528 RepID=A0A6C0F9F1_9ZZZZ
MKKQNKENLRRTLLQIMRPYAKFIVKIQDGIYLKTRFGVQKLRDDKSGLYLKNANKKKLYLHRWNKTYIRYSRFGMHWSHTQPSPVDRGVSIPMDQDARDQVAIHSNQLLPAQEERGEDAEMLPAQERGESWQLRAAQERGESWQLRAAQERGEDTEMLEAEEERGEDAEILAEERGENAEMLAAEEEDFLAASGENYYNVFLNLSKMLFRQDSIDPTHQKITDNMKILIDTLYYGFTHIYGLDKYILSRLHQEDIAFLRQTYMENMTAANKMGTSFGSSKKEQTKEMKKKKDEIINDSFLRELDSDLFDELRNKTLGRNAILKLENRNREVINLESDSVQHMFARYDKFASDREADISVDKEQHKKWRKKIISEGIDFENTSGLAARLGWENTFKQNNIKGWRTNSWDLLRKDGDPVREGERLTAHEKKLLKQKCRCTLCGCFMYVETGNPFCETMIQLEHQIPKSGATELYLMMMWWHTRLNGTFVPNNRRKYTEFVFFKNIGGVLATIPSIFMYCCTLCNQIKSDMKPLVLVVGEGDTAIGPNRTCLENFNHGLKNNFLNFFAPNEIDVIPDDSEGSWRNCGLARKTSCAAIWVIQFILTYSFDLRELGDIANDPFALIRDLRVNELMNTIRNVGFYQDLGGLTFDSNDIETINTYYDNALNKPEQIRRERFFGRHVGPSIRSHQDGRVIEQGDQYKTLADKYIGINAVLLYILKNMLQPK